MTTVRTPISFQRSARGEVVCDVPKRTLSNVQLMTRAPATDGGIVIPGGVDLSYYRENPVVLAKHAMDDWGGAQHKSPVIGRALDVAMNDDGLVATVQFADTELGREYATLYGCSEEGTAYARAWSFGWKTLEQEWWGLEKARAYCGELWDEGLLPEYFRERGEVWVATKSRIDEFSAVAIGADRQALTRAQAGGVRLAGDLLREMDLSEARGRIRDLEQQNEGQQTRLESIERDLAALTGKASPAAGRGDAGEEVASTLRQCLAMARSNRTRTRRERGA